MLIICFNFLDVLHDNHSANKVVWKSNPSVCLLIQLADNKVLPTTPHAKLPSRFMQISQNVDRLVSMHVSLCLCLCVFQTRCPPSICPYVCLLPYLPLVFLSVFSFRSLPFITAWIPKCKMAAERRERGRRTFLMEGFYILTSLPSLFLNLVQWGGKTRRQTEEKNINKLHVNWSAAQEACIVAMNGSHACSLTVHQVQDVWLDGK